ncbi:hypothetical protein C2C67_20575 [Escherichia coli]|nr:hypothetical protein [Escherichia coli]EFO3747903.1 hypothetical protein [Escherichia coli]
MDELEPMLSMIGAKKIPKRRAQVRGPAQLRVINPVLANPEGFSASLKRWHRKFKVGYLSSHMTAQDFV